MCIESLPVTVQLEVTGVHHRQIDASVVARLPTTGEVIGHIDIAVFGGDAYVCMIETAPTYRRRGIATALCRRVHAEWPDARLLFGVTTRDGEALVRALTHTYPFVR